MNLLIANEAICITRNRVVVSLSQASCVVYQGVYFPPAVQPCVGVLITIAFVARPGDQALLCQARVLVAILCHKKGYQ